MRPAQQGSWITENFVFALVKAAHWRPAPYTPPADQPDKKPPMRRWQIGTKFDTEKRTFGRSCVAAPLEGRSEFRIRIAEYEGVIYGVPSSIWMVFGWNTDDDATSSSPQRQIEALYFNANGESVVNFTMAVDADVWAVSLRVRDVLTVRASGIRPGTNAISTGSRSGRTPFGLSTATRVTTWPPPISISSSTSRSGSVSESSTRIGRSRTPCEGAHPRCVHAILGGH